MTSTMVATAEDLSINLEVLSADRDRIKMVNQARALANREELPDYAVVVNELQQGQAIAEILESAGIPYLFLLNRLSPEQKTELKQKGQLEYYLGSVAPDNYETGYMTATALINAKRRNQTEPATIRMLALLGDTATPAAIEREAGMRKAVSEATGVRLLRAFSVDWLFARAKRAVEQFLMRSDTDIIWTASGPIAFGAMEAVTESGRTPGVDVRFAGVGWFPNALDAVSDHRMEMTYGGYFISGAWSMVILHDVHAGIALENSGEVVAPLTEVNRGNIRQFQQYIRNINWSIVNFADFSRTATGQQTFDFSARSLLDNISHALENTACSDC